MARRGTLPGFGLSMGVTVAYLSLLILLPLATIPFAAADAGLEGLWRVATSPRTIAAFRLSLLSALLAAIINLVMGTLLAWTLVRYSFPLRRLLDGLIDLPFALPTAVAGIALATLYAPSGWIGRWFEQLGTQIAFTPAGVVVALVFVGLPFVVRSVQPVLLGLAPELEEAAASLGAGRLMTIRRVVLPQLAPAMLTGATLSFARGLGEYGSVIFIAGNIPLRSEIVPLLIMIRLEEFDYEGAAVVAFLFLLLSFSLLLLIHLLSHWRWRGKHA